MPEHQNIEYKSVWKDEFLKWICGFANAQGGKIFIGKKDDGTVTGLKNSKQLLEIIPNKITTILGIVADVNLHQTPQGDFIENADSASADQACLESVERKAFIEIVVEPQPNPVNYKGEYPYRSGSTKQELKGAALDKFLLQKYGKKWDGVAIPNVAVSELKQETFDFFKKKGIESKRLSNSSRKDTSKQLLNNLKLIDGGNLKRAALLLFHPDPEKFVTGAFIKIGFFRSESDLQFQDDIHGNLFEQVEKTMELLLSKYTRAIVSYRGISRIETYEYPEDALREALLNAVAHKDYAGCTPIQIRVYPDRIKIWNEGQLPEKWTVKNLLKEHSSRPYNPDIANAFFRSGYVEAWGRGIEKMTEQCTAAGLPVPIITNKGSDFWITFRKDIYNKEDLSKLGLNNRQIKAVLYVKDKGKITNKEYQELNNTIDRTALRDIEELMNKDIFKREGDGKNTYYRI